MDVFVEAARSVVTEPEQAIDVITTIFNDPCR